MIIRKYSFKFILLTFTLSFICSCNHTHTKDIQSQFYSVEVGSKLILNKPIVIKANTARTFFQSGQVTKEKNLNIYYPHCSITMNNLTDTNRTIMPTMFIIYKVVDDEEYAQIHNLFASINSLGRGDGPSIIGQATYYYLKSIKSPDVRTLECIQWGDPYDVKYVSIADINLSLGEFFTLEIADK